MNERVERILDSLVPHCDRKELVYFIKILDEEGLNAISLPGGYIYMNKELVEEITNDDQLASVIAHELGHNMGLPHPFGNDGSKAGDYGGIMDYYNNN